MVILILFTISLFIPTIIASFLIRKEKTAITVLSYFLFFLLPIIGPLIYLIYYYSKKSTEKLIIA